MSSQHELPPATLPLSNGEIAARLEEIAELLDGQGANPFRIQAYRAAAGTIRDLPEPVHEFLQREGWLGLTRLRGIGQSLARSIQRLCETDRLGLLSQLRGDTTVEDVFNTVPGIGPKLAARIHDELGIESLSELQAAAWDGRLAKIPLMGPKKIRAVRESLAGRFRPAATPQAPAATADDPPVSEILDIDDEYRRKARADRLTRIAPRRFNPSHQAWLPILHTHRGERHYTALFSNTARAHELGTTSDWVVVYRDDKDGDGQWTVVTSRFGKLQGRRIVRGREAECAAYYRESSPAADHSGDGERPSPASEVS